MHLNLAHQSVKSCVRYLCRAVSTLADIFLVFRTLLNCLKCIIYEDCYRYLYHTSDKISRMNSKYSSG